MFLPLDRRSNAFAEFELRYAKQNAPKILRRVLNVCASSDVWSRVGFGSRDAHPEVPIFWLPSEVITDVLLSCLDSSDASRYYMHLRRLTQVCLSWYALIHHTPAFWTVIWNILGDDFLALVLRRSKDVSLRVTISCSVSDWSRGKIAQILTRDSRWQSLKLLHPSLNNITSLQGRQFPILRELHVLAKVGHRLPDSLIRGDGHLQHVELRTVTSSWTYRDLRVLVLEEMPSGGPTLEQLGLIITSSPFLSRLALRNIRISKDQYVQKNPAALLHLDCLSLVNIGLDATESILGMIDGCISGVLEIQEDSSGAHSTLMIPPESIVWSSIHAFLRDGALVFIRIQRREI